MRKIDADALQNALKEHKVLDDAPIHVAATVEQYIDCAPTVDEWISVKEGLPKKEEYVQRHLCSETNEFIGGETYLSSDWVLVTVQNDKLGRFTSEDFLSNGKWTAYPEPEFEVTHWMPSPEPPKED